MNLPKIYCASVTDDVASGATVSTIIELTRPGTVLAIALAARESDGTEIPRRLLQVRIESGGVQWPAGGRLANAELVTGTGQQASSQAVAELLTSEGATNQLSVSVKNLGSATVADHDICVWVVS